MPNLQALPEGATVTRAYVSGGMTVLSELSTYIAACPTGLMRNRNNPHILGLNAQEISFVPAKVALVEGQADVIFLERGQESLGVRMDDNMFGLGVGGAEREESYFRPGRAWILKSY